jgi:glycosyltransferase involved in cell wall biosynthesis
LRPISICINTQTPLVQFLDEPGPTGPGPDPREGADLATLREEVDYRFSPGGVTRMVYPLVRRLLRDGVLSEAHWVALSPHGPRHVKSGGLNLYSVALEADRLAGYGKVKEAIWGRAHEMGDAREIDELFWTEAFSEYAFYNRITAERLLKLDKEHDFDVFYIHDFQQLPVGQMLGTLKPKVFRWHIPFEVTAIPVKWRSVLAGYLSDYDVIVVSADRYAKSLEALHPKARILQQYPYVDPDEYSRPPADRVQETAQRIGLAEEDVVALVVARMDPMKGHDRAIEALATVAKEFPHLKLVLVGNGSFSGSGAGLGLSKASDWRAHLEALVRERHLEGRVVFTGHLNQADLDALYERSWFTILPSIREGFGLVAVESWLHERPAIVTDRAGIAELVEDGENGLRFDPDDPKSLVRQIRSLMRDRSGALRRRLTKNGKVTAKQCSLQSAIVTESQLLAETTEA